MTLTRFIRRETGYGQYVQVVPLPKARLKPKPPPGTPPRFLVAITDPATGKTVHVDSLATYLRGTRPPLALEAETDLDSLDLDSLTDP